MPETTASDKNLLQIANRIAGWARDGEQVEAFAVRSRDTDVVVYGGDIESLSTADSEGVGVRVIADGRQGFAYAGTLHADVLEETLAEARDNAAFGSVDEFFGLPDPDGVEAVELDLYREELATFPADKKIELAVDLERRVREGDPRIRTLRSSNYKDGLIEAAVASSTGVSAEYRRTVCYVAAMAIAGDGDDTQTGYGLDVGRTPSELDIEKAAADAIDRSTRLLGAKKPASARLTVVFDPRITGSLLSILGSTLNGESVLKGRSLFADRVGEEVSVGNFTLVDDPTNPEAFSAASYDAEGLASRRTVLIDNGVLQGFVYNTYAARRAGTASTANAVRAGFKSGPAVGCRAISLVPGAQSHEEIIAGVELGLLVQSVSGIHSGVNPISGDFSVGAEGLMIRDGQLAEPVREITIASTIQRMLKDVTAIGSDIEWLPGAAAGQTLAIADVSMAGV